jgi:hypothetical protein
MSVVSVKKVSARSDVPGLRNEADSELFSWKNDFEKNAKQNWISILLNTFFFPDRYRTLQSIFIHDNQKSSFSW